ncbi:hypothetical protein IW262DRAFT_534177 [Armillaria fumosa]|nr:hypothetical protein IW262DRAFT_534177 [Armillaria fumosa]
MEKSKRSGIPACSCPYDWTLNSHVLVFCTILALCDAKDVRTIDSTFASDYAPVANRYSSWHGTTRRSKRNTPEPRFFATCALRRR